jgi:hypothetical protein
VSKKFHALREGTTDVYEQCHYKLGEHLVFDKDFIDANTELGALAPNELQVIRSVLSEADDRAKKIVQLGETEIARLGLEPIMGIIKCLGALSPSSSSSSSSSSSHPSNSSATAAAPAATTVQQLVVKLRKCILQHKLKVLTDNTTYKLLSNLECMVHAISTPLLTGEAYICRSLYAPFAHSWFCQIDGYNEAEIAIHAVKQSGKCAEQVSDNTEHEPASGNTKRGGQFKKVDFAMHWNRQAVLIGEAKRRNPTATEAWGDLRKIGSITRDILVHGSATFVSTLWTRVFECAQVMNLMMTGGRADQRSHGRQHHHTAQLGGAHESVEARKRTRSGSSGGGYGNDRQHHYPAWQKRRCSSTGFQAARRLRYCAARRMCASSQLQSRHQHD